MGSAISTPKTVAQTPLGDRVVVITGASSGIGLDLAVLLDSLGYVVVPTYRTSSGLAALQGLSSRVLPFQLDVRNDADITALAARLKARHPAGIYAIVSNAGSPSSGPLETTTLAEHRRAMDVNYFGAVAVTMALLPLVRRQQGHIIFISSVLGLIPLPFNGPYVASKFALESFAGTLRQEVRPFGVSVAVISAV